MTAARTFAIIAACVAVLALAVQFSRRGPAVAQSSVPTQAALDAMLNPGPLTKARPAARPAPDAQEVAMDKLRSASYDLARQYRELDMFRDIRGESRVMVGMAFFQVDYAVKSQACLAVSQARAATGLSRDYTLREPMNGRIVGYFSGTRLNMD